MAIEQFKKFPFHQAIFVCGLLGYFSVFLLVGRIIYSGSYMYSFLIWNLFLAIVPLFVSFTAHRLYFFRRINRHCIYLLFFVWLIFFPNALYIITDFIHLRIRGNVPLWYDLILVFAFVWNGLIIGFLSLRIMHKIIEDMAGKIIGWVFACVSLLLSGFGVYVGRFLRWNSWDIISQPHHLFLDVLDRLFNPARHPRTYIMSLILWLFFFLAYVMIMSINEAEVKFWHNKKEKKF